MSTGLNVCLGIKPTNPCPAVDAGKTNLFEGFVPASQDGSAAQVIVDTDRADELTDRPHLTQMLRTESHTYFRLTGLGPNPDENDVRSPTCEECTVSECLLHTFTCLPADPYDRRWHDGQLRLRFALRDREELTETVSALRNAGYCVELRHLSRDDESMDSSSNVLLNLESLTPRQQEALRIAAEGNYFGQGGADTRELAGELGISTSTFSSHTRTAVHKLLEQAFEIE